MSTFGDRLRDARTAAGMSQERLGIEMGVTKGAVSAWENDRGFPSYHVLLKLRNALRQSLDALMADAADDGATLHEPSPATYYNLSAREFALLQRFRGLSPRQQRGLLDVLRVEGDWAE